MSFIKNLLSFIASGLEHQEEPWEKDVPAGDFPHSSQEGIFKPSHNYFHECDDPKHSGFDGYTPEDVDLMMDDKYFENPYES